VATQLADYLFYFVALAILVSQAFILRSTARGMRQGVAVTGNRASLEWAYAVVPAIALVALLWFSWHAMHPESIQVRGVAPSARST
jgi:heme/copper-type cytochrome/quinol oxidase subunit 2